MTLRALKDPRIARLRSKPPGAARPEVAAWLALWIEAFSDESLRAAFLETENWRRSESLRPGRTRDGLREIRFDVSGGEAGAAHVDLLSEAGFEKARWRFGEDGVERVFDDVRRVPEGWRARLLRPAEARRLYVWSPVHPDGLRVRLVGDAERTET